MIPPRRRPQEGSRPGEAESRPFAPALLAAPPRKRRETAENASALRTTYASSGGPTGGEHEMQAGSTRSLVRGEQLRFVLPPEVHSPARGSAAGFKRPESVQTRVRRGRTGQGSSP